MAHRRSFDTLQFEFYVDGKYDVIEMFDGWMEYISGQTTDEQSPFKGYRMNYPSSYKTNVYVTKFEKGYGNSKQEGPSYQMDYSLVNAFQVSLIQFLMVFRCISHISCIKWSSLSTQESVELSNK